MLFLVWQHRAAIAARSLGFPAAHTPALGVGVWFIPVANLWMPYQALRDCLPPGHPARHHALRAWLAYVALGVLNGSAIITLIFARPLGIVLFVVALSAAVICVVNARIAIAGTIEAQDLALAAFG